MKKISREEASMRIFKIAKGVGEQEAIQGSLTPLQTVKVRNAIAKILAAADIDDKTLDKIGTLDLNQEYENYSEAEDEEEKNAESISAESIADDEIESTSDEKDDPVGVSLMKIGKGTIKQFINSNKNKKLNNKDLFGFVTELKSRGFEFKPSTLAKKKLGELFVAIDEAVEKQLESVK